MSDPGSCVALQVLCSVVGLRGECAQPRGDGPAVTLD